MESTVAYRLYTCLNREERLALAKWLQAHCRKPALMLQLAQFFQQGHTREQALAVLAQAEPNRSPASLDTRLTNLCSQFKDHLENFIAYQSLGYRDNAAQQLILIMRFLRDRPSPHQAYCFEYFGKKLDQLPCLHTAGYYRNQFEHRAHRHVISSRDHSDHKPDRISPLTLSLDLWWVYQRVFLLMGQLSRLRMDRKRKVGSSTLDLEAELSLMEQVVQHQQRVSQIAFPPFLRFLVDLIRSLETSQSAQPPDVPSILQALSTSQVTPTAVDRANLFNYLYTHLQAQRTTLSPLPFAEQMVALYAWAIEQQLFALPDFQAEQHYLNLVPVFAAAGEYERVMGYLMDMQEHLPKERQQSAYLFSLFRLHLKQGKWDAARSILDQFESHDPQQTTVARAARWVVTYELMQGPTQSESLLQQLHRDRQFISDQKGLNNVFRQSHLCLVRYLTRLVKAQTSQALQTLLGKVQGAGPFAHQPWLIDKIQQRLEAGSSP